MAKYLTIDIHTHILPENIPNWKEKFGYGGFIHLDHHKPCCAKMMRDDGKFFREIEDNCWSAEKRIHECDHHHVDVQVLSTVPVMFSYWAKPEDCLNLSMFLNDHIAEIVQRYPKRFVGLGTIPMQSPQLAIKELERCKKIGLKGIQIGTNINQENLNEEKYFEIFKACEESGMAVFIHPWEMMGEKEMQRYWLPWLVGMPAETTRAICSLIFGGVFEKLPDLRVAFAHGGGSFPSTVGRIEHGFNCRPDLVAIDNNINPREYLGKFWIDSLVHDPVMLDFVVGMFGANRIALGTDYPFPLGELEPGKLIKEMPYERDVKELLLHGSALEWLGMQKENFI
jgi:aminocarboxymuconate-semialdehyde decarboxylase